MALSSMLHLTKNFSALSIHSSPWSVCLRGISIKAILEKLQLPEKPKRPMGIYLAFAVKKKKEILTREPNLSVLELSKKLSHSWSQLSDKEKQFYKDQFDVEFKKYKEDMKKFEDSLTPEQVTEINQAISEVNALREKKIIKRMRNDRIREFNKPKFPRNPFYRFLESHERGDVRNKDFWKVMAKKWKSLPEKEKEKYFVDFRKEKDQFLEDLAQWEEEMISKGNYDVVRTKTMKVKFKNIKALKP